MSDPRRDLTGEPWIRGDAAPDSGLDLGGGSEVVAWHGDAAPYADGGARHGMPSPLDRSEPAVIAFPVLGRIWTPLSGFLLILAGVVAIAAAILVVQPDDDVECGDWVAPDVMRPGDYCAQVIGSIPVGPVSSYEEKRADQRDLDQFGTVIMWVLLVLGSLVVLFGAVVLIAVNRRGGLAAADPHSARDT